MPGTGIDGRLNSPALSQLPSRYRSREVLEEFYGADVWDDISVPGTSSTLHDPSGAVTSSTTTAGGMAAAATTDLAVSVAARMLASTPTGSPYHRRTGSRSGIKRDTGARGSGSNGNNDDDFVEVAGSSRFTAPRRLYTYVPSCDFDYPVQVTLQGLTGDVDSILLDPVLNEDIETWELDRSLIQSRRATKNVLLSGNTSGNGADASGSGADHHLSLGSGMDHHQLAGSGSISPSRPAMHTDGAGTAASLPADLSLQPDLCIEVRLMSLKYVIANIEGGTATDLCPAVQSRYHTFTRSYHFNEVMKFPVTYADLPRDVMLVVTAYYPNHVRAKVNDRGGTVTGDDRQTGSRPDRPLGGTYISLFTKSGKLRKNRQKMHMTVGYTGEEVLRQVIERAKQDAAAAVATANTASNTATASTSVGRKATEVSTELTAAMKESGNGGAGLIFPLTAPPAAPKWAVATGGTTSANAPIKSPREAPSSPSTARAKRPMAAASNSTTASISQPRPQKMREMDRLEKLIARHDRGAIPQIEWLDNITWRVIEQINRRELEGQRDIVVWFEFPAFDHPVIYHEEDPIADLALLEALSEAPSTTALLYQRSRKVSHTTGMTVAGGSSSDLHAAGNNAAVAGALPLTPQALRKGTGVNRHLTGGLSAHAANGGTRVGGGGGLVTSLRTPPSYTPPTNAGTGAAAAATAVGPEQPGTSSQVEVGALTSTFIPPAATALLRQSHHSSAGGRMQLPPGAGGGAHSRAGSSGGRNSPAPGGTQTPLRSSASTTAVGDTPGTMTVPTDQVGDHDLAGDLAMSMSEQLNLNPSARSKAAAASASGASSLGTILPGVTPQIWVHTLDPELSAGAVNLVELKHRRLLRSHRRSPMDRSLRPDIAQRNLLTNIVRKPPSASLSRDDTDLLWKFRFYLTSDKKALTKFLRAVDWQDPREASEAVNLLKEWEPIDIEDSLELLNASFVNTAVREYAVSRLKHAPNHELLLYLLQLVQALRYERIAHKGDITQSPLARFLIKRAVEDVELGNFLHWYIYVEEKGNQRTLYAAVYKKFRSELGATETGRELRDALVRQGAMIRRVQNLSLELKNLREDRKRRITILRELLRTTEGLNTFDCPIPLPLDPKVMVEGIRADDAFIFKSKLGPLRLTFRRHATGRPGEARLPYRVIYKNGDDLRQDQLVVQMTTLMDRLMKKENLDLRITPYTVLATDADSGFVQFVDSEAVSAVLKDFGSIDAYLRALTVQRQQQRSRQRTVSSSAGKRSGEQHDALAAAAAVAARRDADEATTTDEASASAMAVGEHMEGSVRTDSAAKRKSGDRDVDDDDDDGDELKEPTSPLQPSPPATVLSDDVEIDPDILDSYVRSVAGYSIITYILGIGDRHMDNIMLTDQGTIFHIDFGYILGRDPKPFPAAMKLSSEMLEPIRGDDFVKFLRYCFSAFLLLRRSAHLILNLFGLMLDAKIPDIALEPDKAVNKIQEKFFLELNDEDAVRQLKGIIDASSSAIFPQIDDLIHRIAQSLRR
eukprot:Clim_evm74s146 gene=Clim_evmTU74s146